MTGEPTIDLVVNSFERTYRDVLSPGFFQGVEEQNGRRFTRRWALINNVEDLADALARAQSLVESNSIDGFSVVAEHLDRALSVTGLSRGELEPLLHHSDCVLVATAMQGSPWLLYWDGEARLVQPVDWIGPAVRLLERDSRLLIANPSWELAGADGTRPGVEHETIEVVDGFAIGRGFSDQVFLGRRSDLGAPIYQHRCLAQIRYPTAHKTAIVESRIDAYMRHCGRLRATALDATYVVDDRDGGSTYSPEGWREKYHFLRNAVLRTVMRRSPWLPQCCTHAWY